MATPVEKLADSLNELKRLQDSGVIAIKTDMLSRTHRERLIKSGFIQEVLRGWAIAITPTARPGDSTNWYSNYWAFCIQYLEDRFFAEWSLSAEQSLFIHAGNTTIPKQLLIRTPNGNNSVIQLINGTSMFLLKANLPPQSERLNENGLRLYTLPAALVSGVSQSYSGNEVDVRTALSLTSNASDILRLLLDGGHSTIAGRLAGAFRNIGKGQVSDNILSTMKGAGYDVRETDPFNQKLTIALPFRSRSPYESRIRLMWANMRADVLKHFPKAPGIPQNKKGYMNVVEQLTITDAYHSLSIERYKVTPELIEKVRNGTWDIKANATDKQLRDAMAAKGYLDAFNLVKNSVERIFEGRNAGEIVDNDHANWYVGLFGPSVSSGILKASDLAGYRNIQVYIGNSMHTPLNKDAVRDAMPVLFELLRDEPEAAVRAVLGHFIFVFIHPYMDGNGRMGRFFMNAMLASGGYPWTVIPVEKRDEYMNALEQASVHQNIVPFAEFMGYLVNKVMEGKPVAEI